MNLEHFDAEIEKAAKAVDFEDVLPCELRFAREVGLRMMLAAAKIKHPMHNVWADSINGATHALAIGSNYKAEAIRSEVRRLRKELKGGKQ